MKLYCSSICKEELDSIVEYYRTEDKDNFDLIKLEVAVEKTMVNFKDQLN